MLLSSFLALLGWNPGTEQEMFTMDELVAQFDLSKCSKAGARFAYEKGIWFNHEYMLQKSDDEVALLFAPVVAGNGVETTMDRVQQECIFRNCVILRIISMSARHYDARSSASFATG